MSLLLSTLLQCRESSLLLLLRNHIFHAPKSFPSGSRAPNGLQVLISLPPPTPGHTSQICSTYRKIKRTPACLNWLCKRAIHRVALILLAGSAAAAVERDVASYGYALAEAAFGGIGLFVAALWDLQTRSAGDPLPLVPVYCLHYKWVFVHACMDRCVYTSVANASMLICATLEL